MPRMVQPMRHRMPMMRESSSFPRTKPLKMPSARRTARAIQRAWASLHTPYSSLQQRARLCSFMASIYTDTMMPTRKSMAKLTNPQMPEITPPVMVVSICWAPGSTLLVSRSSRFW